MTSTLAPQACQNAVIFVGRMSSSPSGKGREHAPFIVKQFGKTGFWSRKFGTGHGVSQAQNARLSGIWGAQALITADLTDPTSVDNGPLLQIWCNLFANRVRRSPLGHKGLPDRRFVTALPGIFLDAVNKSNIQCAVSRVFFDRAHCRQYGGQVQPVS